MTDDVDRAAGRDVSRETVKALHRYVDLLTNESERQNLISKSTIETLWSRHILDSAQLIRFAPEGASWADVGSGAGLPGIVLAILTQEPVTLIEPRKLRCEFLQRCIDELRLENATLHCAKAERVSGPFDVITARAVASIDKLFTTAHALSHAGTRWILPKGRSGAKELAEARRSWQGHFWTEPSITEGDAVIVLAEGVRPRGGTSR